MEEEVVCPNCAERQSKRILCRSCATNMPMGIAAKLEAEQEARAARLAEFRARRGLRPVGDGAGVSSDAPTAWGLGFSGRMARLPYATAGAVVLTVLGLLLLFVLQRPSGARVIVLGVGLLMILFISLRLSVLRCHDCNRSGWWTLLMFVPYVDFVVGLLLSVLPGSQTENDYGGRPRKGHWLFALLSVGALCLTIGLGLPVAMTIVERGLPAEIDQSLSESEPHVASNEPLADATAAFRNEYAAAPPHKAFAVSSSGSWGWKSGAASPEDAVEAAMATCEAHRKPYTPPCRPINVNGQ